jgi:hypothetical protein
MSKQSHLYQIGYWTWYTIAFGVFLFVLTFPIWFFLLFLGALAEILQ